MALSLNTVLEVRSTGSNTNGGGFVTGASGTDWSQQNSAQYAFTDGVTAGTTTFVSATANFGTDVVGNLIYIQGGTGSITAGWYQIISRTNSTTIVLDRSTGLTSGTGVTFNIGGALASLATALSVATIAGQIIYWQNTATYSISSGLTMPNISGTQNIYRIIGYTTTRGDNGQVTIQPTTGMTMFTVPVQSTNELFSFENIIFDGNSVSSSIFTDSSAASGMGIQYLNCVVKRFSNAGPIANLNDFSMFFGCEIASNTCTSNNSSIMRCLAQNMTVFIACYFHDNVNSGTNKVAVLYLQGNGTNCILLHNVFYNNTGTNMHAVMINGAAIIRHNIFHLNGGSGIYLNTNRLYIFNIIDNIFTSNGQYGIDFAGSSSPGTYSALFINNNAYYNNTSGALNKITAGSGDVTLTGLPYVSVPSNFALNSTANQGAACKAVGTPGILPFTGSIGTGYPDIGVFQHQDAGGAGGMLFTPNMEGT